MADDRSQLDEFLNDHPLLARGAALGPRAARASRSSVATRVERLRQRAFFTFQCAVSAAVAYYIAERLLGHPTPFFAAVATLVALGQSYGQRLQRVAEIVVGVAIGVLIGDLFVQAFGGGYWQLAVVVGVAMLLATILDAGVITTTQAGIQAAFITLLPPPPGGAMSRWQDATVGGLVALAAATITPASPLRRPRQHASEVIEEIAAILRDAATALRNRDLALADATLERSRRAGALLATLQDLADDGLAVVRQSPFRRGHRPGIQAIADLLEPLDFAVRNLRVLTRRVAAAVRRGEPVPASYVDMVADLSTVAGTMASSMRVSRLPVAARPGLIELAARSGYDPSRPNLSAEVIRAQVRSIVVDLLMVTGLTFEEAVAIFPRRGDQDQSTTT